MTLYLDSAYTYRGFAIVVVRDKPNGNILEVRLYNGDDLVGTYLKEEQAKEAADQRLDGPKRRMRP